MLGISNTINSPKRINEPLAIGQLNLALAISNMLTAKFTVH